MKARYVFTFLVFFLLLPKELRANDNTSKTDHLQSRAANCTPPTSHLDVSYNDVKMRINTNGVLWADLSNNRGTYSVGANNPGVYHSPVVFFSGSIWIGGKDVNGQLKLAAMLYGTRGNDYFPGPLSVNPISGNYDPNQAVGSNAEVTRPFGEATVNAATCVAYDRFFSISKIQVREFIRWWECNQNMQQCQNPPTINPETLNAILNWPAHGDELLGQDKYLAPFYDKNQNGIYDPLDGGDYPWYDFENEIDCQRDRRNVLKGDETHWWVFNDKGNIHSETGGAPIGLEIRAQAFSFKTNNEINQATFYNYEIINRSSQTLYDTYFGKFADPDIWGGEDDYVGCDVSRGVAYAMNGFEHVGSWWSDYTNRPPAVGIDILEGPYQDDDGKDNVGPVRDANGFWHVPSVAQARADNGIVYSGLGVGYGDGIVDNERMGMKHFMHYNRTATGGWIFDTEHPVSAPDYYLNLTGHFRGGQRLRYGGFGRLDTPGANPMIIADYMFPGDSDPLGWGVHNAGPQAPWSEFTINNPPGDRRFIQSVGPFTMKPGAVNNLTLGVVYARGANYIDSRDKMLHASTKAQALFDNCFRVVEPPHAPRLRIQELENQLVLMIDNPGGNNMNEDYAQEDKTFIIDPGNGVAPYDKFFRFEGYQIFQVKHADVSVDDLDNPDLARLTVQCDIQNGVSRLINYYWDDELGVMIPQLMVDGSDAGIRHSFSVKEDLFAPGTNKNLVNHKTYHFMAIAYAHNEFKPFVIDAGNYDGQIQPYLASKLSWDGGAIQSVSGIPRNLVPGMQGTFTFVDYGIQPEITRLDGRGNMGLAVDLHEETVKHILKHGVSVSPKYKRNRAPIDVKVVDPLNVAPGYFELHFVDFGSNSGIDTARWVIRQYDRKGGELLNEISALRSIGWLNAQGDFSPVVHEQLIPEWGISVRIEQYVYQNHFPIEPQTIHPYNFVTEPIESSIHFADSSKQWLTGIQDQDGDSPENWILTGLFSDSLSCYRDKPFRDTEERFENLVNGTISHFSLLRNCGPMAPVAGNSSLTIETAQQRARLASAPSIDLVFTADKSLWTRSVVIELCQNTDVSQGNAEIGKPRQRLSVDKNGLSVGQSGYNASEGDLVSQTGMGWFPGYAIDVETGRRLNIAFGENSFLSGQNGSDMLWNPTSKSYDQTFNPVFGGQHVIYVISEKLNAKGLPDSQWANVIYDDCASFYEGISSIVMSENNAAWRNVTWVMYPMLAPNRNLLETDVTLKIRVKKRFEKFLMTGENEAFPAFEWNMDALATQTNQTEALHEALAMINVVPNPYYAFSAYENNRFDRRIKITNLPERCVINIFNMTGQLIRSFDKQTPMTSLDWDLTNHDGQPIAGGVYLIHVHVPNIGDRVLKWFGGMREPSF